MNKTLIHAHRGASYFAPENTMSAFKKALDEKADLIELDIHQSADGHLVVMHDETLNRTSNGSGLIKSKTKDELLTYDCGSWFSENYKNEKIPFLDEVLEWGQKTNLSFNIEIKVGSRFYNNLEQQLLNCINNFNMHDRVIISSFDHYALKTIRQLDSSIKTGILYTASLYDPWKYALELGANALHPYFLTVDPILLSGCMKNKIQVNPYTINDEPTIEKLLKANVTGLITNKPKLAYSIRDKIQGGTI
jgi:glycerophosphoryl diester phosphodiesterase